MILWKKLLWKGAGQEWCESEDLRERIIEWARSRVRGIQHDLCVKAQEGGWQFEFLFQVRIWR